jgi:hypothetical protein
MKLERLKEQIGYLKFWQGVVVVTDISVVGWFVSAIDTAPHVRLLVALLAIILLTFGIILLHRQIERQIDEIGHS